MSSCTSRVCFHCIPKLSLTISTLVVFLSLFDGCSHPVEPPTPPQPPKDPHNYTWTVDTLFYSPGPNGPGNTRIEDLYGINDTMLYAACYDAWAANGSLWKFDGKHWQTLPLGGGKPMTAAYHLLALKTVSERDIYVFGYHIYFNDDPVPSRVNRACAAHFNGATWQELSMPKAGPIYNVDHDSPSMTYCGGLDGALFSFDGSTWNVDTLKNNFLWNWPPFVFVAGATSDGGVWIQTRQTNPQTGEYSFRFLKYKDKNIPPIAASSLVCAWGGEFFWKSKEGNLYSCGTFGAFRFSGTKWTQIKGTSTKFWSIYGFDETHIFLAEENALWFYDGTSWTTLNTGINKSLILAKIWCSQNEVFVAFYDGIATYVLHGK